MTRVGHCLVAGISLSLGLEQSYFADRYTSDPLILFRIFNYPSPLRPGTESDLGVREHTDYGLLTILRQDMSGGLEVKTKSGWVAAPPRAECVCLQHRRHARSRRPGDTILTPSRVGNLSPHNRLSFPFFFDPNFSAEVKPIDICEKVNDDEETLGPCQRSPVTAHMAIIC